MPLLTLSQELPPLLGRPLAFAWAGRTAHPDLTPATINLDKVGQPIYLETGIGALRYDSEGTGFAINQTYKDDDNDGVRSQSHSTHTHTRTPARVSRLRLPLALILTEGTLRHTFDAQAADMRNHQGSGFDHAHSGRVSGMLR